MAEPAFPLRFPEREDGERWPTQGTWTYEDVLRLPDDGRRYEVIKGTLYVTPAPTFDHQVAVTQLGRLFGNFVAEHAPGGVVLVAPFDVRLPQRIADPVQPDVLFFRDGNAPRSGDRSFEGIPDLVIEVLSPTTRRFDERVKLAAYGDAGVPEVWIADPYARTIIIQRLDPSTGSYAELCRGAVGESVESAVLPGFHLRVDAIFPQRR